MDFKIINTLTESRLFPALGSLKKYTSKETCDLAFLYFITLEILKNEFEYLHVATAYAKRTCWYNGFEHFHPGVTDLYLLLHQLSQKDENSFKPHKNNDIFLKTVQVDDDEILSYLRRTARNQTVKSVDRKFLISLENDFEISDASYRSMRRLCYDWRELTDHQKKLLITRLLMALRHRARLCDLLPFLEELSNKQKLELENVHNPETGEHPKNIEQPHKELGIGGKVLAHAVGGTLGALGGIWLGSKIGQALHHKKDDS